MIRIIAIIFFFISIGLSAQVSEGGLPYSFDSDHGSPKYAIVQLDSPDLTMKLEEDQFAPGEPEPTRIGLGIPVDIDLVRDGSWTETGRNKKFLSLGIKAENAVGMMLYYRSFQIPEGGRLYIFSKDRMQLIGAYTSKNNPSGGYFATEIIYGDELLIEYNAPGHDADAPRIEIDQVQYIYKDVRNLKGLSGPCEVNVNCSEGSDWQNEKRSVAKIVLKAGTGTYLCTGALMNNVLQDSTPYFLTARHCGASASLSDYSQWMFYFNYESLDCENPQEDPQSNTIAGSSLLAEAPSGTTDGSDFKLLRLSQQIPEEYNPYFAGWNWEGFASISGVGIHHPKGDIKKISTYTSSLVSTLYGQSTENPDGKYWKVLWTETVNGHGVTEGGSSGSPLFDNTGKVVGTLTGGGASCSDLTDPDFYGKISAHWTSNGSQPGAQLKPYLDPENSGLQSMEGFGYGNLLSANFIADTTVISIGGQVAITDHSNGDPESWNWAFYGGDPSVSTVQTPGRIIYNDYGAYDVSLIVGSGALSDTLVRKDYIRVMPNLYPNPASEYVIIDFGRSKVDYIEIEIFNIQGQMVGEFSNPSAQSAVLKVPIGYINAGQYILRVKTNIMEDRLQLIIY